MIMLLTSVMCFYMLHYDFWITFITTILSQAVNIALQ